MVPRHLHVCVLASAIALAACNRAPEPAAPAAAPAVTAEAPPKPADAVGRPTRQYSIEEFVDTTTVAGASFSPDESRILFSSNRSGVWNAYTIPVAGGDWTPVTQSTTDNNYAVAFFPADDRLLITRDTGGDELNHLYVIAADGSEKDLTPGDNLKAQFYGFTHDGSKFRVSTNERDAKFFDIYEYDAKTYERTRLFENTDGYEPGALSDDGRYLVLGKTRTTADNDLYLLDRETGKTTHLTPHEGNATYAAQDFDGTCTALYYTSNEGGEFSRLRRYMLAGGTHEDVRSEPWDIVDVAFSHNGKYRVDVVNVDGSTEIDVFDAASGAPVALPTLPSGEIRGVRIANSESRMAFYLNGDRQPNDLYTLTFGEAEPKRLTQSLNPKIDAADLVDSSVVRFKSFDGMEIPNILWKPHQATVVNKVPAVVLVHGGPGGQTTRAYNYAAQFLANNGYVVLGINNRGSSGYGQTFFTADDGKHGREPLWDCVEAKKYLQTLDYVDPDRIGIMGGSYGGYMTLAALAFQPDEFKVGVDIFGVSNWVRTLESIPPYWESFREALYTEIGNPETQRDFLVETSPAFHGDKITKPLLVIQGANDPRVIKAESDDIVAAVKKNNVPVEYVVFDDEGHGFTKKKNQIEAYGAILEFLDTHLKGLPAKQG
ncbi:S9 family peptidase [Chiayiivirga flava]|uniref:Acyl-peptide hydrolase n=1 Tax=Chiayiivirga flava TaxID=659595 RepID=A0A7W8G1U3_9GAMM|nr:S9 family peptidase [Chiayiivirga flava]MBB5208010.1 dipeptidyl aminopeptidase/acylaminoacyl peptidase [Chiayiivirga flava]